MYHCYLIFPQEFCEIKEKIKTFAITSGEKQFTEILRTFENLYASTSYKNSLALHAISSSNHSTTPLLHGIFGIFDNTQVSLLPPP